MRVTYESKLYVSTTNCGFEIGLYTESNINTWFNMKAKPNWICSGKCSEVFFKEMQNLHKETKIKRLEESNVKYKAVACEDIIFLKIFFDDADNLIRALQAIEKTSDPKEKFKENIFEKVTAFIYKNQELNEISNYSMVSKGFRRFFTRKKFFGNEDILSLPEGCVTIIESFLAHQSNLSFFKEQIRTYGLKSKISRLIPEDSFTIIMNPHNSSKIDPKNNPNIKIKFKNDTHAQLIASKLMLHIYHPQSLYRSVRNSTTLQISDPDLTIVKKIGSGKYNNILFPKQPCKPQEPRVDRITTEIDLFTMPLTFF